MTTTYPPAAKLTDAAAFKLLGDILDPGRDSPFELSDDFTDAAFPLIEAYREHYGAMKRVAEPDPDDADPDAAFYARADYEYETARDRRDEREAA